MRRVARTRLLLPPARSEHRRSSPPACVPESESTSRDLHRVRFRLVPACVPLLAVPIARSGLPKSLAQSTFRSYASILPRISWAKKVRPLRSHPPVCASFALTLYEDVHGL